MPTAPLSDRDARQLAQKLWGTQGGAWHPSAEVRGGLCWCVVGITHGSAREHLWTAYGTGETWEKAFADARERGN